MGVDNDAAAIVNDDDDNTETSDVARGKNTGLNAMRKRLLKRIPFADPLKKWKDARRSTQSSFFITTTISS